MKEQLEALRLAVTQNIKYNRITNICQYNDEERKRLIALLLDAYNTYQTEERGCVDYIFDVHNPEDLKCCIDGGMTINELAELANTFFNPIGKFFFGVNHPKPEPIPNEKALLDNLISWMDEIVGMVITYPQTYPELYQEFITFEAEKVFFE